MVRFFCWLCLLVGMLPCAEAASAPGRTFTDFVGRDVVVTNNPGRVVCLGPGALRLVSYVKATDRIVGIEELEVKNAAGRPYWHAHPELKSLPVVAVGGPEQINRIPEIERILVVKPDLVLVTSLEMAKADEFQKKIGVPVFVLSYGKFASFDRVVLDSIRTLGQILGRTAEAEELLSYFAKVEKDLARRTQLVSRSPIAYVGGIGSRGTRGIVSTTADFIPFQWLKVDNLAHRVVDEGHVIINNEKLLSLDPEIIFFDTGSINAFGEEYRKHKKVFDLLKAFKNRKVFTLYPFNWYATNIGSAIIDAYAIGRILYPKEFADVDLREIAGEVYTKFVGRNVLAEMEQNYGGLLLYPDKFSKQTL